MARHALRSFPRLGDIGVSQRRKLSLAYTRHDVPAVGRKGSSNPVIIILHGLFGSKQNNRSISKALAQHLGSSVYALDLRNHGDSPHHAEHTYSTMADDVEQFVDENIKGPVILIGHSMGAKVAMTLAIRRNELVRSLVSVDNAPVDASLRNDFPKYVRGLQEVEKFTPVKQTEADSILQQYEERLSIRQFLLTNLVRSPHDGRLHLRIPLRILADGLAAMGDFPFANPEEQRFEGPALFIRGTQSHYVPDDVLPTIGRFFPRFELRSMDCGHWVISERPEEFKKHVVDFLEKDGLQSASTQA